MMRYLPYFSAHIGKRLKFFFFYVFMSTLIFIILFQIDEDKFAICGVHLPNSEDFAGYNEVQISVALGFVAHLVEMIAYFLHIPPRYPILHAGSRSKVIDHIAEKIPDKERE